MSQKKAHESPAAYCSSRQPQVSSIGIQADSLDELVAGIKKGFPVRSLEMLRDKIGITEAALSEVVQIPLRTMNRRKKSGTLDQQESERVYRLARLFERALSLFEDEDKTRRWLKTPNRALAGRTPLEFADTEVGAREVEDLIGRLEHGVHA
jgi:putative toxin-antitoxin system antitoxin component (TIGR02293 family)